MSSQVLKRRRRKRVGEPPGSLLPQREGASAAARLTLFEFDKNEYRESTLLSGTSFHSLKDKKTVSWLNVDGTGDSALLERLGAEVGIHPLVLEDVQNPDLRPKMEDYGDYLFLSLRMLSWEPKRREIIAEQVSLVLGREWVISFQEEKNGDVFDAIRDRIRTGKGRIRRCRADYVAYLLVDSIVDGYFLVLEGLEELYEEIEGRVVVPSSSESLGMFERLMGQSALLRRSVWPLREAVHDLLKEEIQLIDEATGHYLRDVYDHLLEVVDTIELLRETAAGLLNLHISALSKNMNSIMKVLTIIATIFMPLSFLASLYGMNFHYMPELAFRWGYPAILGVMAVVTVGMLVYFRRRKWL